MILNLILTQTLCYYMIIFVYKTNDTNWLIKNKHGDGLHGNLL